MAELTVGSLFSGIGGIELGLERTGGFETVWQVEKDEFCRKALAKHWPGIPTYRDVRDVDFTAVEQPDCLCGGFPCQNIASANRQGEGIEGKRSSLWFEFVDAIRTIRPKWVLAENVASLRWAGRGMGVVHRDLAEIGYRSESDSIPASVVGANHRRERVFIVAHPSDEPSLQTDTVFGSLRERWESWCDAGRLDWSQAPRSAEEIHSSHVVGADDGLSDWMDKANRALGNAVVPQVAEFIGEQILEAEREWWQRETVRATCNCGPFMETDPSEHADYCQYRESARRALEESDAS